MKRIVIIEDDKITRESLGLLLQASGYEAVIIDDFKDVVKCIIEAGADLVLLDINIPYINGEVVLQNLRKESTIPVIMVTSRDSETDEMLSMSFGADDYVTKPYNPNILLLRIRAVLKRSNNSNEITYRDLDINLQKGIIKRGDEEIVLTKSEMIIFNNLLSNQNKIVSRDELMTDLWNNSSYINDNALTVNISRLRGKLAELGIDDAIETRKGIGYILI